MTDGEKKKALRELAEAHLRVKEAQRSLNTARHARDRLLIQPLREAIRASILKPSVVIDGQVVTFNSYDARAGLDVTVTELVDGC